MALFFCAGPENGRRYTFRYRIDKIASVHAQSHMRSSRKLYSWLRHPILGCLSCAEKIGATYNLHQLDDQTATRKAGGPR